MHVSLRVCDRLIKSLRRSVLVKKNFFFICQECDTGRAWKREKGRGGGRLLGEKNGIKKDRVNFKTRKNNYCTSGLHLVNMLGHLDSFGPWVRSTSLSLHGLQFKHVLPWTRTRIHLSSSPHVLGQTRKWIAWFIYFLHLFISVLYQVLSQAQIYDFPPCDKSRRIVVGFPALPSTGKQVKNKTKLNKTRNQRQRAFYVLTTTAWESVGVDCSDHCLWIWSWPHSTQTHCCGWLSLPCHSAPSACLLGNEVWLDPSHCARSNYV